jgi:type VI secretion system protein ImpG
MNREFLDLYNRELELLKEQAADFAEEYPGIAGRLGGLIGDRMDPMVQGLMEGTAFLATRVQLKLKHEFPEFTNNLIEQLVPHYLAPTPSALLARVLPTYGDPALREGRKIKRGSYLDATYVQRERGVSCRYRLTGDIELWPFELTAAEYFAAPAPLQAMGLDVPRDVLAGLKLTLTCRSAANPQDEASDAEVLAQPALQLAACRATNLPVYFLGDEADAVALYEQCFANCCGIYFRTLDNFGDPVKFQIPVSSLVQIGLDEADALLPHDGRVFHGFDLLRELFMFPRKFLGFRLTHLSGVMQRLRAKTVDIVLAFNAPKAQLAAAVKPERLALFTAPAVNLFEKTTGRIEVKPHSHEYHVVPDRSRYLDFEPHRVLDVFAHYPGVRDKLRVPPLYSAAPDGSGFERNLFYTIRRLSRRPTVEEKKYGVTSDYTGTDMFLSLVEPAGLGEGASVAELSLRTLCSNRHLTEHLPVGEGGADFRLLDDTTLKIVCAAGPTPPREPVVAYLRSRTETADTGTIAWRLINMLSLNHLGLVEHGAGKDGEALKEILSMFADMADSATERRIRGIRSLDSRPIVRRVRRRTGVGAARGIEVTVTLDEKAFEGSGIFLLGAILDRFFAEYAAMNSYTETVIRSTERGEVMRWPARMGSRGTL